MPFETPDFRKMTLTEIRENISDLNRKIVSLRNQEQSAHEEYMLGVGLGSIGAMAAAIFVPPAVFAVAAGGGIVLIEKAMDNRELSAKLTAHENLRAQFKKVYKSRPGRKQFDLAARRAREDIRRANAPRKVRRRYGEY